MVTSSIIAQIDEEIARLQQARALLATDATPRNTTPRKTRGGRRILSADARKRIADAQRKRWALHHAKHK